MKINGKKIKNKGHRTDPYPVVRNIEEEVEVDVLARAQIKTSAEQAAVEMVTDGKVTVEDVLLARDLRYGPVENFTWTLKEDEIFVLGDNSANSADSRRSGPVKVDALLGRVWAVAWPPSRIRRVR